MSSRSARTAVLSLFAWMSILGGGLLAVPGVGFGIEQGEFDPGAWDELLREFVQDGRVDYQEWQNNGVGALDAFLEAAGEYDLSAIMGKEPKAAFLVNAYNAWAIRQILDHYPVDSVQEIPGFFDRNELMVAGEKLTLEKIEEKLAGLMRQKPEFALLLVPGTSGWPPLLGMAYSSENYPEESRLAMKRTVLDGHARYEEEANELHLPDALARYMHLYEAIPKGFVYYYADYFRLSDLVGINNRSPETIVTPIDWTLNDTNPRTRPEGETKEP